MKERIVIVFIAIALGLFVTTLIFFIYQQTKILPKNTPKSSNTVVKQTPADTILLSIDEPKNESITDRRTIQVKGKTNPENTIIVSTNQEDVVASPTTEGQFSISVTIDTGVNKILTRVITPSGEEKTDSRIISFSTEEF